MITWKEFSHLPMARQAQLIFDKGRELMVRREGDYTVRLYALDEFFVEVWYHPLANQLVRVEVVNLDDVIWRYESSIDIRDLFS